MGERKQKMNKKIFTLPLFILLMIALAACGASPVATQPQAFSDRSGSAATQEPMDSISSNSDTTLGFTLTSPDVTDGGRLPVEYTCDGAGSTLALEWSGAPNGTVGYAVIMHHVAATE